MATRSSVPPPVVLTPRASLVRPEGLAFEWVGSARGRYTVRVVGAGGPLLERVEVTGTRLAYPEGAAALQPGARYTVEVQSSAHPVPRAEFEVADSERARIVARDLAELEAALGPGASPSSLALVRAGYLADQRLFHAAREVLLRALRADAEQASLYVLLGNVYERTGLAAQAAEAFEEAQFLATRGGVPVGKP
jgi:tetratricopeptide (TPR) repeat protein